MGNTAIQKSGIPGFFVITRNARDENISRLLVSICEIAALRWQ